MIQKYSDILASLEEDIELIGDSAEERKTKGDISNLLKEQEAVEPVLEQDSMVCKVCGHEVIWQKMIGDGILADEQLDYCPHCGRPVKWE